MSKKKKSFRWRIKKTLLPNVSHVRESCPGLGQRSANSPMVWALFYWSLSLCVAWTPPHAQQKDWLSSEMSRPPRLWRHPPCLSQRCRLTRLSRCSELNVVLKNSLLLIAGTFIQDSQSSPFVPLRWAFLFIFWLFIHSRCTEKMLYVPGRLAWCTSSKHHALAFGPMFTFDSDKILWKRKSAFDGLYSQTVALFYNRKDLIYYGGQFKCYSNRQKNPDGDRVQEDTVRSLFITGWH